MPPLPTTYLLPWDDDDDFSSLFVIRRLLFMAVDSKNPSHYITSHICANFQLQLNVNHAWVALNEIIEVQNALNQWLHFKIELNSRLFAFHIAFAVDLPYRISLLLSRPKPALLFYISCECNSQDSFSHISCSLIISCSWFMNVILHMEFFALFRGEINAKY